MQYLASKSAIIHSDFDLNYIYYLGYQIDDRSPSDEEKINLNSILQNSEIVRNLHLSGGKHVFRESIKSKLLMMALKNGNDIFKQSLLNVGAQLNKNSLDKTKEVMFSIIESGNKVLVTLMLTNECPQILCR